MKKTASKSTSPLSQKHLLFLLGGLVLALILFSFITKRSMKDASPNTSFETACTNLIGKTFNEENLKEIPGQVAIIESNNPGMPADTSYVPITQESLKQQSSDGTTFYAKSTSEGQWRCWVIGKYGETIEYAQADLWPN